MKIRSVFIIAFAVAAAALCFAALCFAACGGTTLERFAPRLSDYRSALFEGEADGMRITVISGVRETPYASDGRSEKEKTEYAVFTLEGYSGGEAELAFSFGGREEKLTLSRHPFRDTLSSEIALYIDAAALTLTVGGTEIEAVRVQPTVDGEYALTLACETAGDPDGEVLLRLTRSSATGEGLYWYAAFVTEDDTVSVLIDAESGEVCAVRGA